MAEGFVRAHARDVLHWTTGVQEALAAVEGGWAEAAERVTVASVAEEVLEAEP